MNVLVTGATGFVGLALVKRLVQMGTSVRAVARASPPERLQGVEYFAIADVNAADGWKEALAGIDVVVHTAARVHETRDSANDPLAEFRRVNVDGTMNVARCAAQAGVKRFVFLSTVKVNGENTNGREPFTENDLPNPGDPYAVSKHEAEVQLGRLSASTGIEIVIVRPVLVFGPGARANLLTLMRWLRRGVPLPLGAIDNRRSFVSLDNLVDFLILCISSASAGNETFLVSDGEDLSTPELVTRLARSMGVRARLFRLPYGLLKSAALVAGRNDLLDRLGGSLQVDSGKARSQLGWSPVVTIDESMVAMANACSEQVVGG